MTPSLPFDLPEGSEFIEFADRFECSMLRFGLRCCNDAYWAFVCPDPQGGSHRLIGVCEMCMDDATEPVYQSTGKTWIQWLEEKAMI